MGCKTCGNPEVDQQFGVATIFRIDNYCSKDCQLAGEYTRRLLTGLAITVLSIFIIFGPRPLFVLSILFGTRFGLFGSLIGLVILYFGSKRLIQGYRGAVLRVPIFQAKKGTPIVKPEYVPKIYSNELKKKILACCYQTARIGETYCVCGRSISEAMRMQITDS
ncbi:MAG: hypothetical protein ACXAD7_08705 [Candidatus Kariarchaeaceae archaeon]|jgi:hypothetical protein